MKDAQREMQAEMQEKQLHMMIKTQERMKRMQVAQMLAVSRERFYWLGSVYGLLLAGATAFAARNKHFPRALGVPIIVGGIFMAYNYDLCWGNKLERINRMAKEIEQEDHWFNPAMMSDEEVNKLKKPASPVASTKL